MIFEVRGRSWGVLMCVGAVLVCLGMTRGRREGFFGLSWGCFMASWAAIAVSWLSLGKSWSGLGAILEGLGAVLREDDDRKKVAKAFASFLCLFDGLSCVSWAVFGPS